MYTFTIVITVRVRAASLPASPSPSSPPHGSPSPSSPSYGSPSPSSPSYGSPSPSSPSYGSPSPSMPFATPLTGLRYCPKLHLLRSDDATLVAPTTVSGAHSTDASKRLLSAKTIGELVKERDVPRFAVMPTLLTAREDGTSASLFSVDCYALKTYPVPKRDASGELAGDAFFHHLVWQAIEGKLDILYDIPFVQAEYEECLWARSHADWTVFAQDYEIRQPHRPYCEGPPAHPLNAKVWWVVPIKQAFSQDRQRPGDYGIMHPLWVDCLRRAHDLFYRLAQQRLTTIPDHRIRKLYSPLNEHWAARFDFGDFARPMLYNLCTKAWLIAQAKTRDMLGILNYFDSLHLRQYPLGPTNPPWVYNFVGVRHETLFDFQLRDNLRRDGVPILESKTDSQGKRYDICHTDDWVKVTRHNLKTQYGRQCKFDPEQYRERQCLMLHKLKAAVRPTKRRRVVTARYINARKLRRQPVQRSPPLPQQPVQRSPPLPQQPVQRLSPLPQQPVQRLSPLPQQLVQRLPPLPQQPSSSEGPDQQPNLRASTLPRLLAILLLLGLPRLLSLRVSTLPRLVLPRQANLLSVTVTRLLAILLLLLPQQPNLRASTLPRLLAILLLLDLPRLLSPRASSLPRLVLPRQANLLSVTVTRQLAIQLLLLPQQPNIRRLALAQQPACRGRAYSSPSAYAHPVGPYQSPSSLPGARRHLAAQHARSPMSQTALPIPQPAELASSPTRGVIPPGGQAHVHPASPNPWEFRLKPEDPEEEDFGTPISRLLSPPSGALIQEPPSPAWARSPSGAPHSKASSVSNPAEEDVSKWTRRMTRLLVKAPDPKRASDEQMGAWLQETEGFMHTMDGWVATDLSGINLYLVHLEEFLLKHVHHTSQRLGRVTPRPRKGYKRLPIDAVNDSMRDEIAAMKRHAELPANQVISACNTPQELIDELARNRVWETPWFGGWSSPEERKTTESNIRARGAWLQRYFEMFDGGDIEFVEEMRGPVIDEARFLLAWHIIVQFPDPLPRRDLVGEIFNWKAIEADIMKDAATDAKLLWNYDLYSSIFIRTIEAVDTAKPALGNADMRRLTSWFESYQLVLSDSVPSHTKHNSPYTVEFARPVISTTNHALAWLAITEDLKIHVASQVISSLPRVLLEQTQMRDGEGRYVGQRAPPLTREMLLSKGVKTMEEGEFHYRYGQHTALSRNAPRVTKHPALPAEEDEEQEQGYEEDQGLPEDDEMETDSSRPTSERDGPLRRRRSRLAAHPDEDKLAFPIWSFPRYDVAHFPTLDQVKKDGASVIGDATLPEDIVLAYGPWMCYSCMVLDSSKRVGPQRACRRFVTAYCGTCKKRPVSVKRYDPKGNRVYDPKAKQKSPDANKYSITIIDDLLREKWFAGGTDLPGNPPGEPKPPMHWTDLIDAGGLSRQPVRRLVPLPQQPELWLVPLPQLPEPRLVPLPQQPELRLVPLPQLPELRL
ncbi:hypothetical protein CALCODRAFT_486859, partial [Calocera cornea HHB12733]